MPPEQQDNRSLRIVVTLLAVFGLICLAAAFVTGT